MTKLALSASIAFALGWPLAVLAEDRYQFEAEFGYSRDKSDIAKVEITGATLNYYFAPLPALPKDHPLDETAFVARAAGLSALLARISADMPPLTQASAGSSAGIELTFRQPDNPLYVRAGVIANDYGKQSQTIGMPFPPGSTLTVETETDSTAYQLAVGGYVAQTTLLALELEQETMKIKTSPGGALPDSKTKRIGLFGRHLAQLPGGEHVALEGRFEQMEFETPGSPSDKARRTSIDATLYPSRMFGLTVGFSSSSGDGAVEDTSMRIGAKAYLTPSVSLFADFEQVDYKGNIGSADRTTFGAALRF